MGRNIEEQRSEVNQPSRMNEHLANERTFLAWIRTSIATISLGFVIARFSFWLREISISTGQKMNIPHTGLSLPIGLGMVAFGALMTLLAFLRYRDIRTAIDRDKPQPRPSLILVTTGAVFLLAIILIVYLLVAGQQL